MTPATTNSHTRCGESFNASAQDHDDDVESIASASSSPPETEEGGEEEIMKKGQSTCDGWNGNVKTTAHMSLEPAEEKPIKITKRTVWSGMVNEEKG